MSIFLFEEHHYENGVEVENGHEITNGHEGENGDAESIEVKKDTNMLT